MSQDKIKKVSDPSRVSYKSPLQKSGPLKKKTKGAETKLKQTRRKVIKKSEKSTKEISMKIEKDKSITQIIAVDTKIGQPSFDAIISLKETLSIIPVEILDKVEKSGTKIVIVKEGQSLLDAGVIKTVDPEEISAKAAEYGKVCNDIIDKYAEKLGKIKVEIAPMSKKHSQHFENDKLKLSKDFFDRYHKKTNELAKMETEMMEEIGQNSEEKVRFFEPRLEMTGIVSPLHVTRIVVSPLSLEDIAHYHGARTTEEIREFIHLVRKLNGNRIDRAQKDYMKNNPDVKISEDSNEIPIDTNKHPVLVPDLCYYRDRYLWLKKPPVKGTQVNIHDFTSLHRWHDDNGKISKKEILTIGQYFKVQNNKSTIILREGHIKNNFVPVHEFGHAYDFAIEKFNPSYYTKFKEKRDRIFKEFSDCMEKFVSGYASTSPFEFVAESFTHYYLNPKLLKGKDEEWFCTIEEFVNQAKVEEEQK